MSAPVDLKIRVKTIDLAFQNMMIILKSKEISYRSDYQSRKTTNIFYFKCIQNPEMIIVALDAFVFEIGYVANKKDYFTEKIGLLIETTQSKPLSTIRLSKQACNLVMQLSKKQFSQLLRIEFTATSYQCLLAFDYEGLLFLPSNQCRINIISTFELDNVNYELQICGLTIQQSNVMHCTFSFPLNGKFLALLDWIISYNGKSDSVPFNLQKVARDDLLQLVFNQSIDTLDILTKAEIDNFFKSKNFEKEVVDLSIDADFVVQVPSNTASAEYVVSGTNYIVISRENLVESTTFGGISQQSSTNADIGVAFEKANSGIAEGAKKLQFFNCDDQKFIGSIELYKLKVGQNKILFNNNQFIIEKIKLHEDVPIIEEKQSIPANSMQLQEEREQNNEDEKVELIKEFSQIFQQPQITNDTKNFQDITRSKGASNKKGKLVLMKNKEVSKTLSMQQEPISLQTADQLKENWEAEQKEQPCQESKEEKTVVDVDKKVQSELLKKYEQQKKEEKRQYQINELSKRMCKQMKKEVEVQPQVVHLTLYQQLQKSAEEDSKTINKIGVQSLPPIRPAKQIVQEYKEQQALQELNELDKKIQKEETKTQKQKTRRLISRNYSPQPRRYKDPIVFEKHDKKSKSIAVEFINHMAQPKAILIQELYDQKRKLHESQKAEAK